MNARPGVVTNELTMRMTKLPWWIVVHRRIETLDTKLASRASEFMTNPLEDTLGLFNFGKYTQLANPLYAFTKVNKMWQIALDNEEDEEDNEEDKNAETEENNHNKNDDHNDGTRTTRRPKQGATKQVQINKIKTEQQL